MVEKELHRADVGEACLRREAQVHHCYPDVGANILACSFLRWGVVAIVAVDLCAPVDATRTVSVVVVVAQVLRGGVGAEESVEDLGGLVVVEVWEIVEEKMEGVAAFVGPLDGHDDEVLKVLMKLVERSVVRFRR